jgi:hypothetical protein
MRVSDAFSNPVAMRRDVLIGGAGFIAAANLQRTALATDMKQPRLPALTTEHKEPNR